MERDFSSKFGFFFLLFLWFVLLRSMFSARELVMLGIGFEGFCVGEMGCLFGGVSGVV